MKESRVIQSRSRDIVGMSFGKVQNYLQSNMLNAVKEHVFNE